MTKFGSATFNSVYTVGDPKCYPGTHAGTHAGTQITILIDSVILRGLNWTQDCCEMDTLLKFYHLDL